jgi:hypothetical protein
VDTMLEINDEREIAAILAALRFYQATIENSRESSWPSQSIATNCGSFEPMGPIEIDHLCERVNCA